MTVRRKKRIKYKGISQYVDITVSPDLKYFEQIGEKVEKQQYKKQVMTKGKPSQVFLTNVFMKAAGYKLPATNKKLIARNEVKAKWISGLPGNYFMAS